MIDLDKAFHDYIMEWAKEHEDEFEEPEEIELKIPELYDMWASKPLKELGNKSPIKYYKDIKDYKVLIGMLKDLIIKKQEPDYLLVDTITENPKCYGDLVDLLKSDIEEDYKVTILNIIDNMDVEKDYDLFFEIMTKCPEDSELRNVAVDALVMDSEIPNLGIKAKALKFINSPNLSIKNDIAEILANVSKEDRDDKIFDFLVSMFQSKTNLALHAAFLADYGDERAAQYLYKEVDTCNYLEYMEIRNAIETLGGVLEMDRDFSDDPYYKAIKNTD